MATVKKTTAKTSTKAKVAVKDAKVVEVKAKVKEVAPKDKPLEKPKDKPAADQPKSIFLPLMLGGVLSGAVGFGTATYYFMTQPSDEAQALVQVQATLTEHTTQLDGANAGITELRDGLDQSVTAQETADGFEKARQQGDALAAQYDTVAAAISDFDTRLIALEKRPLAEAGGITGDAAKAYERELRTMRDLLETQRSGLEKLAAEATARIEGVAQQAATSEQTAQATAKVTAVKVAVSKLQSALDNGGAFEATVANLSGAGVVVPAVLTEAAKGGVPTLLSLQESYPAAARAALAASVKATTGDGAMNKIGSFFRSQVGARSLAPREGDDADAVLSRAEAALSSGDIAGVNDLIAALPEAGQAVMSDWVSDANTRMEAVKAVRVLADGLNGN